MKKRNEDASFMGSFIVIKYAMHSVTTEALKLIVLIKFSEHLAKLNQVRKWYLALINSQRKNNALTSFFDNSWNVYWKTKDDKHGFFFVWIVQVSAKQTDKEMLNLCMF